MATQILIADGDTRRAEAAAEACRGEGFDVRCVDNGSKALESALSAVPEVIVAPLDLPLIDAIKLSEILRANPRTRGARFVFLGDKPARPLPDLRDQVLPADGDPNTLARRINEILTHQAEIEEEVGPGEDDHDLAGKLSKIALVDLLQLLNVNTKTGTLDLTRREANGAEERGLIHLQEGELLQATTGAVEGEKALYRLLTWTDGAFAFAPKRVNVARRIQQPLRALLLEGVRQLDEARRLESTLPPTDAHVALRVKSTDLPNMVHPLSQEVLLLLEIYTRVQDIVDHCSFPDYQVLRTLHTLSERGMIEIRRGTPVSPGSGDGLFAPAQARRLRDWLDAGRPKNAPRRDGKLLLLAPDPGATADFVRLLRGIGGIRLEGAFAGGTFSPHDLTPIGRIPVDRDVGIELIHVPTDARYQPLWPLAAHGALGSVLLLTGHVADAVHTVEAAVEAIRNVPRSRIFYAMLLRKEEAHLPEELRENLELIDTASLFLIPLESGKPPAEVLRSLLTRILP